MQRLKLATSNLACSWGSPRPTIKTTTRRKVAVGLGLGKLPNIWASPLIFLQLPRCPLSVSGAFCATYDVKAAVQRLKSHKSDGARELSSDYIINAGKDLYQLIQTCNTLANDTRHCRYRYFINTLCCVSCIFL